MNELKGLELNLSEEFPRVSDEAWRAAVEADLKGADFDKKLVWRTHEGLRVQPYYREGALATLEYLESAPGEAPWHRGHSPKGNSWAIVQELLNPDPAEANQAARQAFDGGADGVSFVSEPTATGIRGVNLQSLDQMRALLKDLPVYRSAIHFRAGSNALPVFANFLAAMKASKADARDVHGSVDYDPLSDLVREGRYMGSREDLFFTLASVLEAGASRMPEFKVLSVQATQWLEAGGSAVQEIAFTLAAIAEYLSKLQSHGLEPAKVLPRMQICFATGSTYFMEIAKLRAARMLVSRVAAAFVGAGEAAPQICMMARTADFNQSLYDPHTNLLRATTEAMASAIGGADAIVVSPFDKIYRAPDETSLRLSRNIQLVLQHEAYLDKVADPAAGSYLFETLTDSLAAEAWEAFQKVEEMGGYLAAAANGFLVSETERVASARRQGVANRKQVLLGVNQYPNAAERALPRLDGESLVNEYEGTRRQFSIAPEDVLGSLETAFLEGSVLADARITLSQGATLLAQPLSLHRAAEPFEKLRIQTERYAAKTGATPSVFLLKMGNVAMRQARAGFIQNFFGCAGFEVLDNLGFQSVDDGVKAAAAKQSDIVVLCSADDEYVALAREACPKLRQAIPQAKIVVAGYPADSIEVLKELGVADFIHVRSVAQEVLADYQRQLGMEEGRD